MLTYHPITVRTVPYFKLSPTGPGHLLHVQLYEPMSQLGALTCRTSCIL